MVNVDVTMNTRDVEAALFDGLKIRAHDEVDFVARFSQASPVVTPESTSSQNCNFHRDDVLE
jgi:hypothetical protein